MTETNHIPTRCEFEMDKLVMQLDVLIASNIRFIDGTVSRIMCLVEKLRCWDDSEAIDLALREALANAIVHGNQSDSSKSVRVCVGVEPDCNVMIVVKDGGSGFDPSQLPNPVVGERIYMRHGRGIFLINRLMDDVNISFDHGTAIYMRRKLAQR